MGTDFRPKIYSWFWDTFIDVNYKNYKKSQKFPPNCEINNSKHKNQKQPISA